jgi:riboflavin biosynthesis pyrimidine reductase
VTTAAHRVDRLWPDPAQDLELDEAFADLDLPRPAGRPLVAANMVSSVDGRTQLGGRPDKLSSRTDRRLMQLYRSAFDAVASGAGTLRADDFYSRLAPDLAERRVARGRAAQPTAILVGGTRPIPTDRRWFSDAYADQPRIAVVGSSSPHAAAHPLPGVETWVAPSERPDPAWLLERLHTAGIGSLLLEGGPTTNAAFLAAGRIDELYWTIGAKLVGTDALPIIAAIPGGSPYAATPLDGRLVSVHRAGDELFLRHRFGALAAGDG